VRGGLAQWQPMTQAAALNATLEFDVNAGSIVARQWTKHPLCSC
jgi:hypothetical protein